MNNKMKKLAESVGFVFDEYNEPTQRKLEALLALVNADCVAICDQLAAQYKEQRLQVDDFKYKNIFAEGEVAAHKIKTSIKSLLDDQTT